MNMKVRRGLGQGYSLAEVLKVFSLRLHCKVVQLKVIE